MKAFEMPEIRIHTFLVEDVITTSFGDEFPLEPFSYEDNDLPVSSF